MFRKEQIRIGIRPISRHSPVASHVQCAPYFVQRAGKFQLIARKQFVRRVGRKGEAHIVCHGVDAERLSVGTPHHRRGGRRAVQAVQIVEPQAADALYHAQPQRLQQTFNRLAESGGLSVLVEEIFRRAAQPRCHSTADGARGSDRREAFVQRKSEPCALERPAQERADSFHAVQQWGKRSGKLEPLPDAEVAERQRDRIMFGALVWFFILLGIESARPIKRAVSVDIHSHRAGGDGVQVRIGSVAGTVEP